MWNICNTGRNARYKWQHFCQTQEGPAYRSTVRPMSRHWSCWSGESNLRARISGDVQAVIRLRPVDGMHLARKKGSPRCAVKLSCREFIKTVPNIQKKKNFFKVDTYMKYCKFGSFGCSWLLLWGYPGLLFVSAATLTHVEFKTLNYWTKIWNKSTSKISREIDGVIITLSWVWLIFRQPCHWEFLDVPKHSDV